MLLTRTHFRLDIDFMNDICLEIILFIFISFIDFLFTFFVFVVFLVIILLLLLHLTHHEHLLLLLLLQHHHLQLLRIDLVRTHLCLLWHKVLLLGVHTISIRIHGVLQRGELGSLLNSWRIVTRSSFFCLRLKNTFLSSDWACVTIRWWRFSSFFVRMPLTSGPSVIFVTIRQLLLLFFGRVILNWTMGLLYLFIRYWWNSFRHILSVKSYHFLLLFLLKIIFDRYFKLFPL